MPLQLAQESQITGETPEADDTPVGGNTIAPSARLSRRAESIAQTILLALLLAAPTVVCVRMACVSDNDIWWHLRTGEWILAHHAVPHVDPYSAQLAGSRWLAYSWLFELVVIKLFYRWGLMGLILYSSAMILAITGALFHLLRRLQSDFSIVIGLTYASVFCMAHLYTPRPWMFTILFFTLELNILMQARKTGRVRELLWLPVIFALWANVHIQFVDGLLILGLAFAESVASRWWTAATTRVRPLWMGAALAASLLATLATPFGWRIYTAAYELASQSGVLNSISEMQAMAFRSPQDYAVLLFALGGVAAMAWRRSFPPFETALLGIATYLTFRSGRDVWLLAVVGAAILAATVGNRESPVVRLPRFATTLAMIAAALSIPLGLHALHLDNAQLQTQVEKDLPMRAVEAVRAHGYSGPLFNDYGWGGYLIWALRMPVSIDGRAALYGDKNLNRSFNTWNAQPDWTDDAQLKSAGLVIGSVKSPLTQVLRLSPRYQLVYEDKLAAVFVAHK